MFSLNSAKFNLDGKEPSPGVPSYNFPASLRLRILKHKGSHCREKPNQQHIRGAVAQTEFKVIFQAGRSVYINLESTRMSAEL